MSAFPPTIESGLLHHDLVYQKRYRDLVHSIEAVVWESDGSLQLTYVSPQIEQWFGYTATECMRDAQAWKQLIHPDDFERIARECHAHIVAGEDHHVEFRMVAKDGRIVWVRDLISVEMRDGVPVRLHGILLDITRQKEAEAQLREREEQFRTIFESALDAMLIADDAGQLVQINSAGCELLDINIEAGGCIFDFFPPADRRPARQEWKRILHVGQEKGEYSKMWDGQRLDVSYAVRAHFLPNRHLVVLNDVTEQRSAQEALQQQREALERDHAILQATLEAAADGICLIDDDGQVVSVNTRFASLWQLNPEELQALQEDGALMAHVLSRLEDPDEFIEKISFLFDNSHASTRDQVRLVDGRTFERYSAPARAAQGQSYGRVWSWIDISESKRHEEQLAYQAFHDPVTGLPNRALFHDRLRHAITAIHRSRLSVGVLFLDLDRFKLVNDSLGHEIGDLLLQQVARRLNGCLRPGDTAARFGGDEFTLLLEEIRGADDATLVSERVLTALSEPFHLDGHEVLVGASIGVVVCNNAREDPEELLRRADVAMYHAKSQGKAQYKLFDSRMNEGVVERLQMDTAMHRAVQEEQFRLLYHPLVDLKSGRILGAEALLRWQHPRRGLLTAPQFLEVAEENGLILPLGRWVLRRACEQLREWRGLGTSVRTAQSVTRANLQMSVNLSARQFQQVAMVEHVRRVLCETGIPANALDLEISESAIMADAHMTAAQLEAFKELGVHLSIDDFGTGYSSLNRLEQFPLDRLKLDQVFVARLDQPAHAAEADMPRKDSRAIVRAICELGHSLGMSVMAEGIETGEQLEQLRAIGCRIGQGYYFTHPLEADEFSALLDEDKAWEECSL